jgi:hypothetical protein
MKAEAALGKVVHLRPTRMPETWPQPPEGFRRISDAWVWERAILSEKSPLDPDTRLTLLGMKSFMNPDGSNCFPAVREIARRTGQSKNTVARCRLRAIELGFLIPPNAGRHARGRQDWYPSLPPLQLSVSPQEGHRDALTVPQTAIQCPSGRDIPTHTSLFSERDHGF